MAKTDYLPRDDAGLKQFLTQLAAGVTAHGAAWGLSVDEIAALTDAAAQYNTALVQEYAALAAARGAVVAKRDAAGRGETAARAIVRRLRASTTVSDPDLISVGLPVLDTKRTPVPVPTSYPVARVDFSQRLIHRLFFKDSATAHSRAKPAGIMGAEIWLRIGAPDSEGDFRFTGVATRSPRLIVFRAEDVGQTAHYQLRWVTQRGQTGPWSQIVRATVAG